MKNIKYREIQKNVLFIFEYRKILYINKYIHEYIFKIIKTTGINLNKYFSILAFLFFKRTKQIYSKEFKMVKTSKCLEFFIAIKKHNIIFTIKFLIKLYYFSMKEHFI